MRIVIEIDDAGRVGAEGEQPAVTVAAPDADAGAAPAAAEAMTPGAPGRGDVVDGGAAGGPSGRWRRRIRGRRWGRRGRWRRCHRRRRGARRLTLTTGRAGPGGPRRSLTRPDGVRPSR